MEGDSLFLTVNFLSSGELMLFNKCEFIKMKYTHYFLQEQIIN